jgi:sugar lactone lactonase YvrE
MTRELTVLASGGAYFEAPRWHDGMWWTSDLYRKAIFSYSVEGREDKVLDLEHQPSGLGWLPDRTLLFVTQEDHRVWKRTEEGPVELHADIAEHCTGDLNDMVVDESGRAFVGHSGFDVFGREVPKTASMIRIDPDGSHAVVAEDLMFPNGCVITDDGRTLIVGEGMAGKYTAFTIADDGSLSDRRAWATLSRPPNMTSFPDLMRDIDVVFDGCRLDAEGAIWAADAKNARCVRIREGGEILDEIPAPPGQNIFACMLGGAGRRTLLLCVAPGRASNGRLSGLEATLQTTHVNVPGAGKP